MPAESSADDFDVERVFPGLRLYTERGVLYAADEIDVTFVQRHLYRGYFCGEFFT